MQSRALTVTCRYKSLDVLSRLMVEHDLGALVDLEIGVDRAGIMLALLMVPMAMGVSSRAGLSLYRRRQYPPQDLSMLVTLPSVSVAG